LRHSECGLPARLSAYAAELARKALGTPLAYRNGRGLESARMDWRCCTTVNRKLGWACRSSASDSPCGCGSTAGCLCRC